MKMEEMLQLIEAVSASELAEFKYEENGTKLSLKKAQQNVQILSDTGSLPTGNVFTGQSAIPGSAGCYGFPAGAPVMAGMPTGTVTGGAEAGNGAVLTAASASDSVSDATQTAQNRTEPEGELIVSPLVGTFYAAPAEDADAFVKVGDRVEAGQVVGIVEAMKLMNEIESECTGTVAEILVKNGEPVEYGQPLFRITV